MFLLLFGRKISDSQIRKNDGKFLVWSQKFEWNFRLKVSGRFLQVILKKNYRLYSHFTRVLEFGYYRKRYRRLSENITFEIRKILTDQKFHKELQFWTVCSKVFRFDLVVSCIFGPFSTKTYIKICFRPKNAFL